MIEKNEILEMAKRLGLNPDTVEKDYVLGWLLFGIYNDSNTALWLFKGGTSLRKCFFETFRFSEDLDFTLSNNSHLDISFLKNTFIEITDFLHEEVGIEFFKDQFKFKVIRKEKGKLSAQGRIHYNGPLRRKRGIATIKLDLTTDEVIVLQPVMNRVHHPYSDELKDGIVANCYAFEEIIAEKVRALAQRMRPRDLYDIIHLFRNRNLIKNSQLIFKTLQKKCSYKKIKIPTYEHIKTHEKLEELEPQWKHMLIHQLPHFLPPMESFWKDLKPFFDWLCGELKTEKLFNISNRDEIVFQPDRMMSAYTVNSILHKIQFATFNRICVRLKYNNKNQVVEPLSFRKTSHGDRLFYGYEREAKCLKAFSLSKVQAVQVTNLEYREKYSIEISPPHSVFQ